ncbi:MAG: hypothetical protein ACLFO1_04680 [Spirochaetaceae bacterium]
MTHRQAGLDERYKRVVNRGLLVVLLAFLTTAPMTPALCAQENAGSPDLFQSPDLSQQEAGAEEGTLPGELTGLPGLPSGSGVIGERLDTRQQHLHETLRLVLEDYRSEGRSATLPLVLGVGFLYGLVHSLLPGHRKTLLFSYFLAEDAEPLHGVIAGALLAALQGVVAVVVVLAVSGAAESSFVSDVANAGRTVHLVSAALILALGLFLTALKVKEAVATRHHYHEEHILSKLKTVSDDIDPDHHDPARTMIYEHRRAGRRRRATEGVLVPAMLIAGATPCWGGAALMISAVSLGVVPVGIAGAFGIALGTAVTLSGIAVVTIVLKSRLLLLLRSRAAHIVRVILELAAALLLLSFGVILVAPSLG